MATKELQGEIEILSEMQIIVCPIENIENIHYRQHGTLLLKRKGEKINKAKVEEPSIEKCLSYAKRKN